MARYRGLAAGAAPRPSAGAADGRRHRHGQEHARHRDRLPAGHQPDHLDRRRPPGHARLLRARADAGAALLVVRGRRGPADADARPRRRATGRCTASSSRPSRWRWAPRRSSTGRCMEGLSTVVEGVHLVPGLVSPEQRPEATVVEVMLAIERRGGPPGPLRRPRPGRGRAAGARALPAPLRRDPPDPGLSGGAGGADGRAGRRGRATPMLALRAVLDLILERATAAPARYG